MVNVDPSELCRLFVYGSLKRRGAHHGALGSACFVREARTRPSFALRVIAGYPALVPGRLAIRGELFEVSTVALPALDAFEGEDYERRPIALEDGSAAFGYVARTPRAGTAHDSDFWP